MKINLFELIRFFDVKTPGQKGDASGIVGLLGEDLNAALFGHFLLNKCEYDNVHVLADSVSTGNISGPRLDRWILVEKNGMKELMQCEIKNWSASAVPGYSLPVDAPEEEVMRIAKRQWQLQLDTFNGKRGSERDKISKVLVTMKKPHEYSEIVSRPVVCYWMPVSVGEEVVSMFDVSVDSLQASIATEFKTLTVFSASLYARSILEEHKVLDLDMPNAERRLKILDALNVQE